MLKTALCERNVHFAHFRLVSSDSPEHGDFRLTAKTMRIMRMLTFFLFAASLAVSARPTAQTITFSAKGMPVEKVFAAIEKQTGLAVFYKAADVISFAPVSLSVVDMPLDNFLEVLLKGQPYRFLIDDHTIILSRKGVRVVGTERVEGIVGEIMLPISGVVRDPAGLPLHGATVHVKGKKISAITDVGGKFEVSASIGDVLEVSYVGYISREVKVSNGGLIEIVLEMMSGNLDTSEVVYNAGYYKVKEKERTGSIVRVDAKTIAQQPVMNVMEALIGRMAGVNIVQTTGVPGGGFKVEIRGINSLRTDAREPLYLVNGVPYPSITRVTYGGSNFVGGIYPSPLNYINPSDIENIEVLKDADATAIYGSRGANGVVLITTKSAKAGKSRFDLSMTTGISKASQRLKLLNTEEYLMMRKEAFANDGIIPGSATYNTAYDVNGTWDQNRYTDWQEVLLGGTSKNTNIQANLSGGNEFTQFSFRGSYLKEGTIFPGNFSDRKGSGTLDVNHTSANRKFRANFSVMYGVDHNNPPKSDISYYKFLPPNAPALYNEDGTLNWAYNKNGAPTWNNPLSNFSFPYNTYASNLVANTYLNYEVFPGLTLRTSLAYTTIRFKEDTKEPISAKDPSTKPTALHYQPQTATDTWNWEPQINYHTKRGNHQLEILVGSTFQENTRNIVVIQGWGYTTDALLESISAAPNRAALSSSSSYNYTAAFTRLNYNYDGQYIINLTGRRDGSSRFGPDKQFANFGAVGAAWVFSKAAFFKERLPLLSFGKLRSSYGITGSDQIPDYGYISTYAARSDNNGESSLVPLRLANGDFSWETNQKLEFALELGLMKDKIFLSTSFYRNRSSNQLVGFPLSLVTGFSSVQYNLPAEVQNTGWEFELNTTNVNSKSLIWKTSANLSIPRNKLLSFPNIEGYAAYSSLYAVGESMYSKKVYRYIGINQQTGLHQIQDMNQDGKFSSTDYVVSPPITYQWYGGLGNSITYKSWQVDIFFKVAHSTLENLLASFTITPGTMNNQPRSVLNRWQHPGDLTEVQKFRAIYSTDYANARVSDWVRKAVYAELKNVSLSWNVPKRWIEGAKITEIKLFAQGQNLLSISKYPGGMDGQITTLPPLRSWVVGFQLSL